MVNFILNQFPSEGKNLTFWRDSTGNEIDLIDYTFGEKKAYEIKSGQTFSTEFFKGLIKWNLLAHNSQNDNFVIYNGKEEFKTSHGTVVPWEKFGTRY